MYIGLVPIRFSISAVNSDVLTVALSNVINEGQPVNMNKLMRQSQIDLLVTDFNAKATGNRLILSHRIRK
jgi:hypothetical protein